MLLPNKNILFMFTTIQSVLEIIRKHLYLKLNKYLSESSFLR